ncbi:MAG: hypothetical protein OYI31_04735 [Chloroflexota bacterium]|nr:hypothetical protein [Chloroflexota bacterium]MDE2942260.1 hypothetical protein [Chloroflexota bacterium]MDE3267748.1 hypothetical protein [Chloroflexota bacterium]
MLKIIASRDLAPIPALAAVAFVFLATFAWAERTAIIDPDGLSVPYWPWKLWQAGALLLGIAGVWWVWLSTRPVPWVRSLALAVLAAAVLANAYSDVFGDYGGDLWRTINPLFIGCSSVAAVALWRLGSPPGRVASLVSAALGATLFANAYFVDYGDAWQFLNPLMILAILAWAAIDGQVSPATSVSRAED